MVDGGLQDGHAQGDHPQAPQRAAEEAGEVEDREVRTAVARMSPWLNRYRTLATSPAHPTQRHRMPLRSTSTLMVTDQAMASSWPRCSPSRAPPNWCWAVQATSSSPASTSSSPASGAHGRRGSRIDSVPTPTAVARRPGRRETTPAVRSRPRGSRRTGRVPGSTASRPRGVGRRDGGALLEGHLVAVTLQDQRGRGDRRQGARSSRARWPASAGSWRGRPGSARGRRGRPGRTRPAGTP